ncbi:PTS system fructose subfamily IIA component [Thermoanaerobacter mathranii subsp. mathranii str. A3]|uniref:PTS system fructose subfamily IIA component n=3 Tax=Thermoanaerobacter TaxID=1754 RepID=B0K7C8_THEP3|nr:MULTISPECIES: PTS sugar transporter subunit IIA [Thermoanaerobacter]MBZ4669425.1 system fructose subfamily component [Defluviitaleaceae bacterium]ABY91454.1 PTS system fructose subfamily IIA component [Thermoanaerobacter sp. X514]ABY95694.1 PTS system fructose subfamily IIA component [Thermoanaerobacter pseudethanolicus ATCC 33223]ADH60006.1 PTS system fructose subfamily IIA component [Thermoanaerobacter mathranii subsp. mathranii str. A3]ADV80622.1 PTS system fructose subfamily IIA compone
MKEKFVLIITHGNFGKGLLNGIEVIMGKQENVLALGLNLGDNIELLRAEVEKIVREKLRENKEVIIAVDLFGGSPFNVALYVMKNYDVKVITGVNMPMLIELLSSLNACDTKELINNIYKVGVDGIKVIEKNSLSL